MALPILFKSWKYLTQFCLIVLSVAHSILFEKNLTVNGRRLYMMLHKQNGNYNSETSIYIGQLNYQCREDDIVEELNLILRDQRLKRQRDHEQQPNTTPTYRNNFILSCMVSHWFPSFQKCLCFVFIVGYQNYEFILN